MTSVVHASFTVTKNLKAPPQRVFAAFADEEAKRKWFGGPGMLLSEKSFDFREGGRETASGKHPNGMVSRFDCIYRDIVPPTSINQTGRIVYSYVMHLDGRKISVSQACVTFTPDGGGTKLVVHEYGDYLDGYDDAGSREHGTNFLMDALVASVDV